jgi:hypothetical protein
MAKSALALRVANLEAEVAQLKTQLAKPEEKPGDWLDDIFGAFDHDSIYAEAMQLGRDYRESLRPKPARSASRKNGATRKKPTARKARS